MATSARWDSYQGGTQTAAYPHQPLPRGDRMFSASSVTSGQRPPSTRARRLQRPAAAASAAADRRGPRSRSEGG